MNEKDEVIQNLVDAGCDESKIHDFLECKNKKNKQLKVLCLHRRDLLEKMHECQRCIDCLDYLVYQMEKRDKDET